MVLRNKRMSLLPAGYLFPEVGKRRRAAAEANPEAKIISLGVGNTTEPLTRHITESLARAASGLGTPAGYSGYGDEQGLGKLRAKIAERVYNGSIAPEEVFVSDGAKCDIGRLQLMFGASQTIAVQDPSYPVYVDGSVMAGATGTYDVGRQQYRGVKYMRCSPENGFFPKLGDGERTDIIYFCSPNNPTGAAATRQELKALVEYARRNRSIIVYDAAYSEYITEKGLPRSIYEIEGAKDVAIEVSSFSKFIGFTGVRLGWTVVPSGLKYDDGTQVIRDWNRVTTTVFNGASNIAQAGGLSALDDVGRAEMRETVSYYLGNAKIILEGLKEMGVESYGGVNAPYIWARFKGGRSWDIFDDILRRAYVVTTPGSGFGPAGEGFLRFSAFGHREDVIEAVERLKKIGL